MAVPEGFVEFGGHHYRYVKALASYDEAALAAAAAGGHLATITSAAENAFLASLLAGQDLGAWLGGSDASDEGVWRWTTGPDAGANFWNGRADGSAPSGQYTNWYEGQPGGTWNGLEEDHLSMVANSDKWNDASGPWSSMGYFIEIEDNGAPSVNAAPSIVSNGGGDAAAITVPENARPVTTVAAGDPDGDTLAYTIAGGADAARFAIDAASGALSFVTAPDFEAPSDANQDNVYQVTVRAADGRGGFDSQSLTLTVTNVDESVGPTPPPGYQAYDGHYYRYVKGLYNYAEAQAAATAAGGHLATITSAGENAFLAGLIAGQDLGAWLGGSDVSDEGVWRWTAGADAGTVFWTGLSGGSAPAGRYANWSVGEPNGIWNGLEEDHFHMMANSDKWNDASGYWSTMGYFVEIEGGVAPGPNHAPVITTNGGGDAAAITIPENTRAATTVAASDSDGDTLAYTIVGGADAARFGIDAQSGALALVAAPDFEAPGDADQNNVYNVVVRAGDGRGGFDSQAIAVSVANANDNTGPTPPPGYQAFDGHFYRFVDASVTHSAATAAAAAAGGHLATISSAQENAFLATLMAQADPGGYGGWLDGSDAASEGVWRWTEGPETGTTFWNGLAGGSAPGGAYTNWLPGEPSQYQGTEEDYMHMLAGTDRWNDIPNSYIITMGYFVEID